jgi:hypothetical protein
MLLDRWTHLEVKAKGESSMSVRRLDAAKSFSCGLVEIRMAWRKLDCLNLSTQSERPQLGHNDCQP